MSRLRLELLLLMRVIRDGVLGVVAWTISDYFLLLEVLLVRLSLIIEGLAMLKDLELILIELNCFVLLNSFIHHLLGISFQSYQLLSTGEPSMRASAEISSLDIKNCDLLPNSLNLCLLFEFLIEATKLIEQRIDKLNELLLKVGDHIGEFIIVNEVQRVHKDLGKLIFLLNILQGIR